MTMYTRRRFGRRDFLCGSVALTGGTAIAALLAACGGSGATPPAPVVVPAATTMPASAPATARAAGGTSAAAPPATAAAVGAAPTAAASGGKTIAGLRIAVADLPESMDPHESISNVGMRVHYFTFDTLIRRDFLDNSKLVPGLATEWKRLDDKTLELTLRQGVLWQDGSPFTAADVKYTFDRLIAKDPKLEVASPGYFPLATVEVLDDFRVRLAATSVDPVLERRFAGLGAQIIPAKYHQQVGTDAFRTKPLGTGPYRMVEYLKDERMTFEAHDRYFGGAPAAKKVTMRVIPETAARLAALQSGEVDLVTNVPPDQIASLRSRRDVVIKQEPLANIHLLRFNMKVKPFDNKLIRQAVSYAIDRKTLVETIWGGNAIHTRGFQYEGEEFFNPNRPPTPYDPERARALLSQGGYANEPIVFLTDSPNYYTNGREAAEVIVEMWRQAGINSKLELIENAQKSAAIAQNTRHVSSWSATSGTGDPDGYLWRNWGPDNGQQKNGWWAKDSAAQFTQLGREARSTIDTQRRFDLYQQMLDQWDDEAPGTTLYAPKETYALRNTIDWTPYPLYYMDLRPYNFKVK